MSPFASVRSHNNRLTKWAESHPVSWFGLMLVLGTAAMMLTLNVNFDGSISEDFGYALAFGVFFGVLQLLFLRTVDT